MGKTDKDMHFKECDLPETTFTQDIDPKIFQTIILQILSKIEGIALLESGFIDGLLRRSSSDSLKGINIEQDPEKHSINIRIELNVLYGVSIPEKAEEIHRDLARELTKLTGLHINNVHVVFKGLVFPKPVAKKKEDEEKLAEAPVYKDNNEDYSENF